MCGEHLLELYTVYLDKLRTYKIDQFEAAAVVSWIASNLEVVSMKTDIGQ